MNFPRINFQKFLLLTISGMLFGLSFPPFKTGIFSLFAFVPLFFVLSDVKGRNFLNSYYTFFVFNLISISWVGGFVHFKDTYLVIAGVALLIVHPFIMSLPIAVFNFIHKNLSFKTAIFSFPFLWVSFEYLHSITEFAFPWLVLGNTLTYENSIIQLAEFVGVYGLSFWIVWMNVLIFILIVKYVLKEFSIKDKSTVYLIVTIFILYFAPKVIGNQLIDKEYENKNKIVRVGIVQPNIDPWEKWDKMQEIQQIYLQLNLSKQIVDSSDLIIWPETAIPFYILQPENKLFFDTIKTYVDNLKFSLLTGFPDIYFYDTNEEIPKSSKKMIYGNVFYDNYNSSFLLNPNSEIIQKYSKIRLVPFSERIPYADFLSFLKFLEWDVGISSWGIGKDTTVFYLPIGNSDTVKFSNLICYESIYPTFVSHFVRKGAEFLTIITNDSWWGDTFGPYQHERFAILRAIENRRWIARCANGGISCFIDPYGNVYNATSMFSRTTIHKFIYTNNDKTFYTEKGDLIPEFSILITAFIITAVLGKKLYSSIRRKKNALY